MSIFVTFRNVAFLFLVPTDTTTLRLVETCPVAALGAKNKLRLPGVHIVQFKEVWPCSSPRTCHNCYLLNLNCVHNFPLAWRSVDVRPSLFFGGNEMVSCTKYPHSCQFIFVAFNRGGCFSQHVGCGVVAECSIVGGTGLSSTRTVCFAN